MQAVNYSPSHPHTNHDSPIAIIGMAGRFPKAKNLDEFWQNLATGVESPSPLADEELLAQGVAPELLKDPDYVKWDSCIDDVDRFDASLFEFNPQEAALADPEHRLFLECAWEALENAGYNPKKHEHRIGIYAGCNPDLRYLHQLVQPFHHLSDHDLISSPLGVSAYVNNLGLSTRVAYKLHFTGPAIDVGTACSTSLVAVHLACNSLRSGDCDMVLAGGISIRLPQKTGYLYQEGMVLSPDGHCHAFDKQARGTVWADAMGIVVLKKLEDAIADGDYIHAVIKGSAINNDGHLKFNYTEPSVEGQAAVISRALAKAGVSPETIGYIETHGTGTSLGDPVEIKALTRAFAASTNRKGFCAIGSVKTNIGHPIIAAGIVGLLKTVLVLQHRQIPPSLNYESPNPRINFGRTPFYVNTQLRDWETGAHPRRAGVSSFGFGGTNAHVILEEAPPREIKHPDLERPLHLFTLSARTPSALKQLCLDYLAFLETHPNPDIADLSYTTNTGREHFPYRIGLIASSTRQLRERLRELTEAKGQATLGSFAPGDASPRIAFLFTGEGAQLQDAGRQLYETQPTFRSCLERCDQILREDGRESLLPFLYPGSPGNSDPVPPLHLQPALFALEYSLAQLWKSWGIEPDAVMGDGIGEYVAACVAGVFSLRDGLKLIVNRAAAGEVTAIDREIIYAAPKIPVISNLTGDFADGEIGSADYWCHFRQSVRSAEGIAALQRKGYEIFLECGPALLENPGLWLSSLNSHRQDWLSMLESLVDLFGRGAAVDWQGFDRDYPRRRVPLPTDPFERESYWLKLPPGERDVPTASAHPLLGRRLKLPFSEEIRFETRFTANFPPYVQDHRLYGTVIVPGASHIAMALLAGRAISGTPACSLEDVVFTRPMALLEGETRTVQFLVRSGEGIFEIVSSNDPSRGDGADAWQVHVKGKLSALPTPPGTVERQKLRQRCPEELAGEEFYQLFWDAGYTLGDSFHWIDRIWRGEGEFLCRMQVPPVRDNLSDYPLHPGLIDSCFQFLLVDRVVTMIGSDYLYIPFSIANFSFYEIPESGQELWCHASLVAPEVEGSEILTGSMTLFDQEGRIIAQFDKLEARKAPRQRLVARVPSVTAPPPLSRNDLYQVAWQARAREKMPLPPGATPGMWLLFADRSGLAGELARTLRERGETCALVFPDTTYRVIDTGRYTIDPARSEDFQRLLAEIEVNSGLPLKAIVHLWSLSALENQELSATTVLESQKLGCGSVTPLLQALVAQAPTAPGIRLWLVTRSAVAIGEESAALNLEQAPLWGLGRVLTVEHPELQCKRLDLDPDGDFDPANMVAELLGPDSEDEIALRRGLRYVPRLVPVSLPSPVRPLQLHGNASYLITGGLGALGLGVAAWMSEQGAKHIVLTGRKGISPSTREAIERIEGRGSRVTVIPADITRQEETARLLAKIDDSLPPLRGIIHAAGVLDDGILLQTSWEKGAKVLAPKLQGSWNLHLLTRHLPLDFWVCFSSISSLVGNPGQGNYAAANAFMDALSHYRSRAGLVTLTINWGPWMSAGMAARVQDSLDTKGLNAIPPERGLSLFGELLTRDLTRIVAAPVEWSKFLARTFPDGHYPSLLRDLSASATFTAPKPPDPSQAQQELEKAPPAKRYSLLLSLVRAQVASVLGLTERELTDVQRGFQELGMDSLMAVELRNRLQSSFGCSLSPTLAFTYPNIEAIANHLRKKVPSGIFSTLENQTEVSTERERAASVQQLSDDDLERLLLEKIKKFS